MAPFNDHIKGEIKERSNGVSELSGKEPGEEGMLICAHLDHTRNENYNNAENGLRVTKFEECAYHQMHMFEPEKIGMDDMENKSVIMSYMKRFYRKGFSLEEVREKIGEAIELWLEYLEHPVEPPDPPNLNEIPKEVQTPTVKFEGVKNGTGYVWKNDSYLPPKE